MFQPTEPSGAPVAPSQTTPPLIGPGNWIGTKLGWTPGAAKGQLVVTLSADQTVLDEKSVEALALYRDVVAQFAGPSDLQVAVGSSLDTGAKLVPVPSAATDLTAYANAATAYLGGSGRLPSAVTVGFEIVDPVAALPPIQVNVTLTLAYFGKVDVASPFALPDIRRVDTRVPANLAAGITAFTARFHQALPGLRLAVDGSRLNTSELWVFGSRLIQPVFTGQPTYFAPAPLFNALQSGTAVVPNFGDFSQSQGWPTTTQAFVDVDGDQLLFGCCEAIDSLLAEPMASAVKRASATGYARLEAMRSAVATAYSHRQLSWLLEQQTQPKLEDPTLSGARAAYRCALQDALHDAYAVDAIVALEATWDTAPAQPAGSELSLLGFVRPTDGSKAAAISGAQLRLKDSAASTGTLYYAFRPNSLTAQTSVTLPLEFVVTHIGVGDLPDGAQAWLALMERETLPLSTPTGIEIPIVNRFSPPPPGPREQRATPSAASPTFAQLLQWEYGVDIVLQPVAQDTGAIVVRSNVSPEIPPLAARNAPPLPLAAALFRFHSGFAQVAPVVPDLTAGKPTAPNIVEAIVDLCTAIQDEAAWAASRPVDPAAPTGVAAVARLTASLAADKTTAGKWNLTIKTDCAPPGGSLSVVPCTLAQTPQPNVTVAGTDPLVISYDPVDANASVVVRIVLPPFALVGVQNARGEAQVTRNGSLLSQFTTAPHYRLPTAVSRFPQPFAPRIVGPADGYDLATIGPPPKSGLLFDWVLMLVRVILGPAPAIRVGLNVGYAYRLAGGLDALSPVIPVVLIGVVSIDKGAGAGVPPAEFAETVANVIVRWFEQFHPSTQDGQLVFDLTLRASEAVGGHVLLEAPNLRLGLDKIQDLRDRGNSVAR